MQLHELTVGDNAYIDRLTSLNALRERMLALGLTKGTRIEVVRKGPSGDPTIYNIRGAMIALRKEEASFIHIVKSKEALSVDTLFSYNDFKKEKELLQKQNEHEILEVLNGLNVSVNPE